ncbi:hypothetical protein C8F04DRAFT_1402704, partial [Mycena alexandri]
LFYALANNLGNFHQRILYAQLRCRLPPPHGLQTHPLRPVFISRTQSRWPPIPTPVRVSPYKFFTIFLAAQREWKHRERARLPTLWRRTTPPLRTTSTRTRIPPPPPPPPLRSPPPPPLPRRPRIARTRTPRARPVATTPTTR